MRSTNQKHRRRVGGAALGSVATRYFARFKLEVCEARLLFEKNGAARPNDEAAFLYNVSHSLVAKWMKSMGKLTAASESESHKGKRKATTLTKKSFGTGRALMFSDADEATYAFFRDQRDRLGRSFCFVVNSLLLLFDTKAVFKIHCCFE